MWGHMRGLAKGIKQKRRKREEKVMFRTLLGVIFSAVPLRKERRSCEAQFHAEFTRLATPGLVVPVRWDTGMTDLSG